MARTAAISLRVEEKVKKAIEKAAKRDERTVAQWVERAIVKVLKEGGYLPTDADS
jgi:predicted HicB family RNase H-like nuclease